MTLVQAVEVLEAKFQKKLAMIEIETAVATNLTIVF